MNNNHSADIRQLNDAFRRSLLGGTVLVTSGIVGLGAEAEAQVLVAVRAFDAFDEDNDPWGEHDFGRFDLVTPASDTVSILFKIDYYDLTKARHADDPADPTTTERVLTIMLASEY